MTVQIGAYQHIQLPYGDPGLSMEAIGSCVSETPVCSYLCLFATFRDFVRNFGGVFAILFEGSFLEVPEEIHLFAVLGGGGGGSRGSKIVNKHFVNKLAFPSVGASSNRISCKIASHCDSHSSARLWGRRVVERVPYLDCRSLKV